MAIGPTLPIVYTGMTPGGDGFRVAVIDSSSNQVYNTLLIVNNLLLGSITGPTISTGLGVPTANSPRASIFLRTDGGVGSTVYVSQGVGVWNAIGGV